MSLTVKHESIKGDPPHLRGKIARWGKTGE